MMDATDILIVGINYAPEPVGIGPYTAEMAQWLADQGYRVEVITAKPYYPEWKVQGPFKGGLFRRSIERGVRVLRCPLFVPRKPSGIKRVIHHVSFVCAAFFPAMAASIRRRPRLVMTVAPSLMSAPLGRLAARMAGARSWLHVQDFEVGAAIATGLLDANSVMGRVAGAFEASAFGGFDQYSSISPQMCALLAAKYSRSSRILEFRNWSDLSAISPLDRPSRYRSEWEIITPHVALYSGNIANKQGVDIIVEAARRLRHRDDLTFVVCGDGPTKAELVATAGDLANVRFYPLQPRENLCELLGLATVHLLPQLAEAADLVLPSKLTNMLASGRPVVATAAEGTGLAAEVVGCGAITPPGDAVAFADAIEMLIDDKARYQSAAHEARRRAEDRWSKRSILKQFGANVGLLMTAADPTTGDVAGKGKSV